MTLRLLHLAPFAPRLDDGHGGGRVTAQLVAGLAAHHEVALLCLRDDEAPQVDEELRRRCQLVEEVVRHRLRPALDTALSRLRGMPRWVASRHLPAFQERVVQVVRTWQPDIVQVEFHVMGQYLSALDGSRIPRVLNQHEPGALAARHVWERSHGAGRLAAYLDFRAWQRYESHLVQHVNAIVVFTEQDRAAMASYTAHPPIITIPFGTVLPIRALNPAGQTPPIVLFVGNFRHPPNADAAVRLARDIFPMVRQECPEAILYIVGAHAPTALRKSPGPNIVITDFVTDLTGYMDRAAVVVAPLWQGGGMRVKVLEALAAGKAVVASSLAAAGIGVAHGDQLLLAENDQQFSREIVRLLGDQEAREALAGRARRWASRELTWERPLQAYEALFRDLVAGARPPTDQR